MAETAETSNASKLAMYLDDGTVVVGGETVQGDVSDTPTATHGTDDAVLPVGAAGDTEPADNPAVVDTVTMDAVDDTEDQAEDQAEDAPAAEDTETPAVRSFDELRAAIRSDVIEYLESSENIMLEAMGQPALQRPLVVFEDAIGTIVQVTDEKREKTQAIADNLTRTRYPEN